MRYPSVLRQNVVLEFHAFINTILPNIITKHSTKGILYFQTSEFHSLDDLRKWGKWFSHLAGQSLSNSPFPSCCMPQFQSESWCTTIQMEMSCVFLCKSNSSVSLTIVEHQDSLRNRDKLGNGPLLGSLNGIRSASQRSGVRIPLKHNWIFQVSIKTQQLLTLV